ncbi:uncharacterized protein TNCV_700581 [Trichonephila clavipes]|nr:uncharacterized protein TNCV_700581 [Trichonephila clavipes]
MVEKNMTQIALNVNKFCHFSLAMDESLDSCSTSLPMFIRSVDEDMNITQGLVSLNNRYRTVTGEDIFSKLKNTSANYNSDWTNLLTNRGNNMSVIKKGLVGQMKQMK